jgi:hypothetical protein
MNTFEVNSCQSCPFVICDNEYGFTACNHPHNFGKVKTKPYDPYDELPADQVHQNCPLKDDEIVIKLPS